jgi:hypothetical protein
MTQTERILEETERTLGAWDADPPLPPDPYMAERVLAQQREHTDNHWRAWRPFLQLRYAAILTLMLLNMITILYLEFSSRTDPSEDLVSVLRDDFQIESSQDNP